MLSITRPFTVRICSPWPKYLGRLYLVAMGSTDLVNPRPLEFTRLASLMERSRGRSSVRIGLIDGPVLPSHPQLANALVEHIGRTSAGHRKNPDSAACRHGTSVAGMLVARRDSPAP